MIIVDGFCSELAYCCSLFKTFSCYTNIFTILPSSVLLARLLTAMNCYFLFECLYSVVFLATICVSTVVSWISWHYQRKTRHTESFVCQIAPSKICVFNELKWIHFNGSKQMTKKSNFSRSLVRFWINRTIFATMVFHFCCRCS